MVGGGLGRRARGSPPCPPQERHHTKAQYQLKSEQISLAQVFSKMEQVVDVLGIEDYSVSQTTLDNVRAGSACVAGRSSPGAAVAKSPAETTFGRGGSLGWGHGGGHSLEDALGPISRGRRGAAGAGGADGARWRPPPLPARCS